MLETLGPTAVLTCSGELDASEPLLDGAFARAFAGGASNVVVDLLDVSFIDSSTVRALLEAEQTVTDRGGWIRLVHSHHMIAKVLEICGVADLLPRWSSVSAALDDPKEAAE